MGTEGKVAESGPKAQPERSHGRPERMTIMDDDLGSLWLRAGRFDLYALRMTDGRLVAWWEGGGHWLRKQVVGRA